ncbi:MAG: hypothetical protein EOO70_03765, partial [Myxococcaceae bacterium]
TDVGRGFQDATLRLTENATCDRGVAVEVQAQGFSPGCVRVSLQDRDLRELATASLKETTKVTPDNPAHLRVLLSEQQGSAFDLVATAFHANCEGPPLAQTFKPVEVPKGSVLGVQLILSPGEVVSPTDVDGDGYPSTASGGSDCDDTDAMIHPGQGELRCDGKDDNCNGATDEGFNVGSACVDALGCSGVLACDANQSQASCIVTQMPTEWFVDEDGDGARGTSVGMSCGPPPTSPGAASSNEDCDESSAFVSSGLVEICDRLDNNCSGDVDEGCGMPLTWSGYAGVQVTADLTAIAAYDQGRKAWIAGSNKLFHVDVTTSTTREYLHPTCQGDWTGAWAAQDGRVFVVGRNGRLLTRIPGDLGEPCYTIQVPDNSDFTGVTGIDDPSGATIYAVASNGRIYRWAPPYGGPENPADNPNLIATVAANLRAIGAARSGDSLVAVGGSTAGTDARAFHFNPTQAGGTWTNESPGATYAGFLRGVHVLNNQYAYAVGENGLGLVREHGVWSQLPRVTDTGSPVLNLMDVVAYSRSGVYVSSSEGSIHFFDGSSWQEVYTGTNALRSLDGPSPTQIWAVGNEGTVLRFHP